MRKVMMIAVCLMLGALKMSAQSDMTADQLRFRNQIQSFLKEEGFVPTIDSDDNSLNWKKEGTRYWLYVESGPDPFYIEIHKGGFNLEENKRLLLESCNNANLTKRCGKACMGKSSIIFTSEFWCSSIEHFRKVFYKYVSSLDDVKEATADYYNDHEE